MAATPDRADLHRLVDALPEQDVPVARKFLEFLRAMHTLPALQALIDAPEDDEPESPDEVEAVRQARDDWRNGDLVRNDYPRPS